MIARAQSSNSHALFLYNVKDKDVKKEEHPFARIKSPKTINNSFKDSLKELFLFINPFGLKNALIFN